MQMDRQRVFREISDPYDFSNRDFYNRYRFYKKDIPYLVNKFCLGLEPETTRGRPQIIANFKIFCIKFFPKLLYFGDSLGWLELQ